MSANEKLTNQRFLISVLLILVTLKCIIFIFSPSKTKRSIVFACSQNKCKQTTSIFSTEQRFFRLFLLAAAKSSLLHWTDNFTILLTSLTICMTARVLDRRMSPN